MLRRDRFEPAYECRVVDTFGPEPIGAAMARSIQAHYGAALAGALNRVTWGEPSDPGRMFQGPCVDPQQFRGAYRGHALTRYNNAELPSTSAPLGQAAVGGVQGMLAGLP